MHLLNTNKLSSFESPYPSPLSVSSHPCPTPPDPPSIIMISVFCNMQCHSSRDTKRWEPWPPLRSFALRSASWKPPHWGLPGAYWRDTLPWVGACEDTAPFPGSVSAKLFFPPLTIWEPRYNLKFQSLGISKQLWRQA